MADWNPVAYLQYTDERSRPFTELVARVPRAPATSPPCSAHAGPRPVSPASTPPLP